MGWRATALADRIEFVCSDMYKPYLKRIAQNCPNTLNIPDRFHVVATINKAIDEVPASEARRMAQDALPPPPSHRLHPLTGHCTSSSLIPLQRRPALQSVASAE